MKKTLLLAAVAAALAGCDRPKAKPVPQASAPAAEQKAVHAAEPAPVAAPDTSRKFIAFGWEMQGDLTPEKLKENQPALAKTGLSGVGIYLPKGFASVANPSNALKSVMDDRFLWSKDDFGDAPARYRRVLELPGLRHCFVKTFFHHPTKRLDWTDDATWGRIAANMRVAAWFAKESGFKGLCVDHEDYGKARQFLRRTDEPPYSELKALARRRGRELFRGVFEEFPDAALLFYWFLTENRSYIGAPDPMGLAELNGDLWPAFANGIMDVMPPRVKFVEGIEWAYEFESTRNDFMRSAVDQREGVIGLVEPENLAKYRGQLSIGFGLYLDSYVNKPGSRYYFGPVNGSRTAHFDRNATAAAFAATEYVWLWGERGKWIDWKPDAPAWLKRECIWPERLAGLADVIAAISDPDGYADRRAKELRAAGQFNSLTWNGTCDPHVKDLPQGFTGDENGKSLPAPFYFWYDSNHRHGKAGIDIGGGEGGGNALRIEGVGSGCVMYHVPEKDSRPGDMFVFEVSVKGRASVRLGRRVVPVGGDPSAWRVHRGLIRIGEGNAGAGVNLCVSQAEGESTWFDNVRLVRAFRFAPDGDELLAGAPALPAPEQPAAGPVRKKLIAHGWDLSELGADRIAQNLPLFDRFALDGVSLNATVDLGGKSGRIATSQISDASVAVTRERMSENVKTFRRIVRHRNLRESFLNVFHAPKTRIPWTDDAAWQRLTDSMRTMAWAAKAGGLRGFLMDQEDYPGTKQFFRAEGDPAYDPLAALARKRGAQVFKAVFEEFPDIRILSFWFLTMNADYMTDGDPRSFVRAKGDLWPAFVNGIFDVIPPEARLIEGDEWGYQYLAAKRDFERRGIAHKELVKLIDPANRDRFRAQMLSGFGLYADMYVRGEPLPKKEQKDIRQKYVMPSILGSHQRTFARNLSQALGAADEYVWIYGCHATAGTGGCVPWTGTGVRRWDDQPWVEDRLPGFGDICRALKDPETWRVERLAKLRKEGRATNLVKPEKRQSNRNLAGAGKFDIDVIGIKPVTAGDFYSIELKLTGDLQPIVRWYSGKEGGRPLTVPNMPLVIDGKDPSKPRTAHVLVRIPEGVSELDLCLAAEPSKTLSAGYSDVEIVNVFDFSDLKPAANVLKGPAR